MGDTTAVLKVSSAWLQKWKKYYHMNYKVEKTIHQPPPPKKMVTVCKSNCIILVNSIIMTNRHPAPRKHIVLS